MRTARFSGSLGRGVSPQGWGCTPPGHCMLGYTPRWPVMHVVNRITDKRKNITFPQLRLRAVNIGLVLCQELKLCCHPNSLLHGPIFTARKRSLGQGNVFTPVCHSVRGGWLPSMHHWSHDRGSASGGVEQIPPQTTGYGQRAGGTPPTGMHSCGNYFSVLFWKLFVNVQFHSQSWRFVGLDPLLETVVDDFTSGQINVTLAYHAISSTGADPGLSLRVTCQHTKLHEIENILVRRSP